MKFKRVTCKNCGKRRLGYKSLITYCVSCVLTKRHNNYIKNKQHCLEYAKKYQKNNPEVAAKSTKKWLEKNPEYHREYYRKNIEQMRMYQQFRYYMNKEIK